jgi:proteic killer suppression protein
VITEVKISRGALKELRRAPQYIQEKFRAWLVAVHNVGLMRVRVRPGWHDEPLQGNRKGQRSIRLNRQWRAIYVISKNGEIEFVEIIEVLPHDY